MGREEFPIRISVIYRQIINTSRVDNFLGLRTCLVYKYPASQVCFDPEENDEEERKRRGKRKRKKKDFNARKLKIY